MTFRPQTGYCEEEIKTVEPQNRLS